MFRVGFHGGLLVAVAMTGAFALVGCSGDDGAPLPAANALTRVVPESAGTNCPAGGQAVQYGVDANGNDQLDSEEVKGSSYVCNGSSSKMTPSFEQIPVGDPRCPNGGTLLKITGGDGADQESVLCNGIKGDQGVQGIQGIQGETGDAGPQGDAGANAAEPVFGQFLASQIVKGAVLTCATFSSTATTVTCNGMKLNGLDVRLGPTEANVVCNAATGRGYNSASGMGVVPQGLSWTAGAWTFSPSSMSPMNNVTCNR
jgi:hypothetical protein